MFGVTERGQRRPIPNALDRNNGAGGTGVHETVLASAQIALFSRSAAAANTMQARRAIACPVLPGIPTPHAQPRSVIVTAGLPIAALPTTTSMIGSGHSSRVGREPHPRLNRFPLLHIDRAISGKTIWEQISRKRRLLLLSCRARARPSCSMFVCGRPWLFWIRVGSLQLEGQPTITSGRRQR